MCSESLQLNHGVPQGSCLGPLLFTLYTSKLFEVIKRHLPNVHAYADDTKLHLAFKPGSASSTDDAIDLFSLYVLFSHFRSRDAARGNSFFQMSSYARANVRITNEKKNKRKIPMRASRGLKWENKMYKLKRSIELKQTSPA